MKIAIVTGASAGIGRAFAYQIDQTETLDEIWVIARRKACLSELKTELQTPIRALALDLCEEDSFIELSALLEAEQPQICLLVHAAGFGKLGALADLSDQEAHDMLALNNRATLDIVRISLPYLSSGSRILLMGSASAFIPLPYFSLYAASKAFVLQLSRALQVELAVRGIGVTCVCPGFVDTEFFEVAHAVEHPTYTLDPHPLYTAEQVVTQALLDSRRGKAVSSYGFTTKLWRYGVRFVPTRFVMKLWQKMLKKTRTHNL